MASCCSTVSSSRAGSGVVGGVDLSSVQNPMGNSLAVQWLGLCAFIAEGVGSIPGRGTKILQAARCGQKRKKKKEGRKEGRREGGREGDVERGMDMERYKIGRASCRERVSSPV